MEPKLKRDIRIAGIGVAAAAVWLPAMVFAMMHLPAGFAGEYWLFVLFHVYVFFCLFNLVWAACRSSGNCPAKSGICFSSFCG